jgi:hypothetical protein
MGGIFPRCRRDCDVRGDAAVPSDGDAYNDEGDIRMAVARACLLSRHCTNKGVLDCAKAPTL